MYGHRTLDEKMRYEPSERFRTAGLRATSWWRWGLYAILFAAAVGFLGRTERFLLYAVPIAAVIIVAFAGGLHRAVSNPRVRAWILGNLWWIIPLYMLMQIALFIWDRIEERKEDGPSNQALHGTAGGRADASPDSP